MKRWCVALMAILVATAAGAGQFIVPRPEMVDYRLIPDQYLVKFTPGAAGGHPYDLANRLARAHSARILFVYEALGGAAFEMKEHQARAMARNPNVAVVEQDMTSHIAGDQANPPSWGIDRIDQRNLPLDGNYHWDFDGTGVEAYVVDGGIRTTHVDFGGRATWGIDCTGAGQNDGNGHGTHVAGILGSSTYGVAKNVSLIAVRVCNNNGSCNNSWISCGFDYVVAQKVANPGQPMVANYSIGGSFSQTINDWAAAVVDAGVFLAVSANNNSANACNFSPSSEPKVFTVGSTTKADKRSSFSNKGTCVDLFAPGSSILSTYNNSDTATKTLSGTSMSSPHGAGAGALVLQEFPTLAPAQVSDELKARATSGVLSNIGNGSPNLLLYTLSGGTPPPPGCTVDADCDDGLFCNGAETCNAGSCQAGSSPCLTGETCDEAADQCVPGCTVDADCDDGLFCNGAETCNAGTCQAGSNPCQQGEPCVEATDTCDQNG